MLLRVESDPEDNSYNLNDPSHFDQIVQNQDPVFRNYTLNRFDLDTLSPAMDKGNLQDGSLVPLDIKKGNSGVSMESRISAPMNGLNECYPLLMLQPICRVSAGSGFSFLAAASMASFR